MTQPLVSIIVPTYNSESYIKKFLKSVLSQKYPRNKLEILIMDGGSDDKTVEIASRYPCVSIYNNPDRLAEPGVNRGLKIAKGNFCCVMAVDNYFKEKNAIQTMSDILNDDTIFAVFPRHESEKHYSLYSKYVNLFTDPFSHFVYGHSANARTFSKVYKMLHNNHLYTIYDYLSSKNTPLIALAQGFFVRRKFYRKSDELFDDIKPIYRLIGEGKKIAYAHSISLYHNTIRDTKHFIRKQRWATRNALEKENYGIENQKTNLSTYQLFKIKIWPLYALSILLPIICSLWGFARDKKMLWILHPYMCFISATSSVYEYVIFKINNKRISRQ